MNLNGVIALILRYFAEFDSFTSRLRLNISTCFLHRPIERCSMCALSLR